ncbi:MAG TPA: ABC transporter substrate-binding protein [Micropepsaceae bacterium]|nr:ABC transporter substrate-binding protein [Micropepsaceae bacterium]
MPVIGFLGTTGPDDFAARVAAFREGLKETGNIEGQNVVIEYRWAEGNYDRLDALAADLVDRQVTVIAAVGGEPAPQAAKKATSTIPTVFIMGTDPVKLGIVRNINRPEGNITGLNFFQSELGAKRLGLVHQLLPRATVIGVLINPTFSDAEDHADEIKVAARPLGMRVHVAKTHTTDGFDAAFLTLVQQKVDALVLANDALFFSERRKLTTLAAHHAMPAIYPWREFAADGGLMSYSPSILEGYRQVGIYTGKVLKGAKPRDLPILQPTKFQFVINLKTAKALGIEIPPILLAQADEVIE